MSLKKQFKPYRWHIALLIVFLALSMIGGMAMEEGKFSTDIVRTIGGAGLVITLFATGLRSITVKENKKKQ